MYLDNSWFFLIFLNLSWYLPRPRYILDASWCFLIFLDICLILDMMMMIYFKTLKRFSSKVIKGVNYSRKYAGFNCRIWFFHFGVSWYFLIYSWCLSLLDISLIFMIFLDTCLLLDILSEAEANKKLYTPEYVQLQLAKGIANNTKFYFSGDNSALGSIFSKILNN